MSNLTEPRLPPPFDACVVSLNTMANNNAEEKRKEKEEKAEEEKTEEEGNAEQKEEESEEVKLLKEDIQSVFGLFMNEDSQSINPECVHPIQWDHSGTTPAPLLSLSQTLSTTGTSA